jgi:hypothetical protein
MQHVHVACRQSCAVRAGGSVAVEDQFTGTLRAEPPAPRSIDSRTSTAPPSGRIAATQQSDLA